MTPPDQETRDAAATFAMHKDDQMCFIHGAAYMQERILKLLRSYSADNAWHEMPGHRTGDQWADWIEKQLGGEKR